MRRLKAVIIDDNLDRREQIRQCLPEYCDGILSGYGELAVNNILCANAEELPDLIIMNGEDSAGNGYSTFEWIKIQSGDYNIRSIPVIVLVSDEYSDSSLRYLEIDDAIFYEGDIDEEQLYFTIMHALDSRDFASDEQPEPVYIEEKSVDRVIGKSFKPVGHGDEVKRSIVISSDERMANLEAALKRGKEKAALIKSVLDEAAQKKEQQADDKNAGAYRSALSDAKYIKDADDDYDEDDIPEEFRRKRPVTPNSNNAGNAHPNMSANVYRGNPNAAMNASARNNTGRRTVVIVDDDERDRKTCELILSQRYNVVTLDSGMKAIDYFIRNTADLLLIDTYMPNLGGAQTLASVRWQPNGRNVPVVFLLDKRYPVARESLIGMGVVGIVQKPLSLGNLAVVVDGFFRKK